MSRLYSREVDRCGNCPEITASKRGMKCKLLHVQVDPEEISKRCPLPIVKPKRKRKTG
jgi:hypothetical protein